MCGLCGVFSEQHWSDAAVTSVDQGGRTRRHERLHRVTLANRVLKQFRIRVSDWNGASYVVTGPTGQTTIVQSIAAVWPVAEQIRRAPIDPLDEAVIAAVARG